MTLDYLLNEADYERKSQGLSVRVSGPRTLRNVRNRATTGGVARGTSYVVEDVTSANESSSKASVAPTTGGTKKQIAAIVRNTTTSTTSNT